MAGYVLRRLFLIVLVLVAVSLLVFTITSILPASVAHLILGPFAPPEQVKALEIKLGLNDPILVQYWRWASRFVMGDFGESMLMNRPVAPILAEAIQRSASLAISAFVLIAVIGIAPRRGRRFAPQPSARPCRVRRHLPGHCGAGVLLVDRRHPCVCRVSRLAAGLRLRAVGGRLLRCG